MNRLYNNVIVVLFSILNIVLATVTVLTLGVLYLEPVSMKTLKLFFKEV